MAQYPNQIYTPREKENQPGIVFDPNKKNIIFAEDIKALDEEVKAIETELGTNPKGAFASVKEFLQYLLSKVKDYLSDLLDVEISNPQDGQVLTYEASTQKWKNKPAAGGAQTFLQLTDTPDSYSGQAGKIVRVKSNEKGLEFVSLPVDWELLANIELSSNDEGLYVYNLPIKKVLKLLIFVKGSTAPQQLWLYFNDDADFNYSCSVSENAGTPTIYTSKDGILVCITASADPFLYEFTIYNPSGFKKLVTGYGFSVAADGTCRMYQVAGQWKNTAEQINTIMFGNPAEYYLLAGSRMLVFGRD